MAENEKQTNKERLKDITDSIERGIQDLFQSDKYAQYLRTMSRFHKYSVNNTMLIYMQKPDATLVAGFNKWRDQFERNVMKGEKGIRFSHGLRTSSETADTSLPKNKPSTMKCRPVSGSSASTWTHTTTSSTTIPTI